MKKISKKKKKKTRSQPITKNNCLSPSDIGKIKNLFNWYSCYLSMIVITWSTLITELGNGWWDSQQHLLIYIYYLQTVHKRLSLENTIKKFTWLQLWLLGYGGLSSESHGLYSHHQIPLWNSIDSQRWCYHKCRRCNFFKCMWVKVAMEDRGDVYMELKLELLWVTLCAGS